MEVNDGKLISFCEEVPSGFPDNMSLAPVEVSARLKQALDDDLRRSKVNVFNEELIIGG